MTTDSGALTADSTITLAGHVVSRLGYGAMQLPGRGVWGPPKDKEQALATVRRAVELGVRVIDTAWYYGPHVSNPLLREALAPYPDDLVLVTKLGGARTEKRGWVTALRPQQLRDGCETDLRELGLEQIPVVHLRWIDGDPEADFAESLGTLVELHDEGKIGEIGLSTVDLGHLDIARGITPIATVSNAYGLLSREDEPMLHRCAAEGIAYLPYFPLSAGAAAKNPAITGLAEKRGITTTQLALAWLLAHSTAIVAIPGTSSVAHLEENVAAASVDLTSDDLALLDSLSAPGEDPVPA